MKLTYLGHSCFLLEDAGYRVVFDPYEDNKIPGLGALSVEADAVFCSHGHYDHNYEAAVIKPAEEKACPYTAVRVFSWHDDVQGKKRGDNYITLLDWNGFRIAHMGDLGTQLDEDQKKQLGHVDVLLIPVGGFYTIDAKEAKAVVDSLNPRIVVPMHYRTKKVGFKEIGVLEDFTKLCENVVVYGDSLELTKEMEKQISVLTL